VLLELRAAVRADKRYDLSDLIRDRLADVDVEVRDTPQGVEWVLRGTQ
jgi:cysteinyl-tRNA synthetase